MGQYEYKIRQLLMRATDNRVDPHAAINIARQAVQAAHNSPSLPEEAFADSPEPMPEPEMAAPQ